MRTQHHFSFVVPQHVLEIVNAVCCATIFRFHHYSYWWGRILTRLQTIQICLSAPSSWRRQPRSPIQWFRGSTRPRTLSSFPEYMFFLARATYRTWGVLALADILFRNNLNLIGEKFQGSDWSWREHGVSKSPASTLRNVLAFNQATKHQSFTLWISLAPRTRMVKERIAVPQIPSHNHTTWAIHQNKMHPHAHHQEHQRQVLEMVMLLVTWTIYLIR